jgi:hypothetical protein
MSCFIILVTCQLDVIMRKMTVVIYHLKSCHLKWYMARSYDRWIRKYMKGSSYGLFEVTVLEFAWKDWRRKISQVASLWPGNPWKTHHVAGPTARWFPDANLWKSGSPDSQFFMQVYSECYNLNLGYYISPCFNHTSTAVLYTCRNHINSQSINLT